jgi:hypothetical protein
MALDPSEVEVRCPEDHCWGLLSGRIGMKLSIAREATFRRAKPKRSRVQEMADEREGAFDVHARDRGEHYREAVQAVCQYAREWDRGNFKVAQLANDIERYFLEPR